jgi:hypothetical protein
MSYAKATYNKQISGMPESVNHDTSAQIIWHDVKKESASLLWSSASQRVHVITGQALIWIKSKLLVAIFDILPVTLVLSGAFLYWRGRQIYFWLPQMKKGRSKITGPA